MAETLEVVITAEDKASGPLRRVMGGLTDVFKLAAGFVIGDILGGAIRSATQAIPDMINAASDLNETISKTEVIFGDAADMLIRWSQSSYQVGQSQQSFLDAASTFGIFGQSAGLTGEELAMFSTDLTRLASDMASFANTTPEDAISALGAALRGEAEPIRRYGVLMNDAALRQAALELGIISTTSEALTPQQRVLAANALIWEQTAVMQGDFERTSGGLANQQRILAAELANVKSTLGSALLPVINTFIGKITAFASSQEFHEWLDKVVVGLTNFADWLGNAIPVALQFLSGVWTNVLQPAINTVWTFLSTIVIPWIQGTLIPWLQVNIPIALQFLSDIWTNTLQPAIQTVWTWLSTVLIPFFTDVVFPWIAQNIPVALQFLSDVWTNVLQPAIQAVWNWLSTVLIPFLAETVFPWLQIHIPQAIQFLSNFWTNVLQPAIAAVWNFVSTVVFPIMANLISWLVTNVGGAIQILAQFWTTTLWPAIQIVANFIRVNVIPLITTLARFIGTVLGLAIRVVSGLWQNVLLPAIQAVGNFIRSTLQPVFAAIGNFLSNTFGPVVRRISDGPLTTLRNIFSAIGRAIQSVIGWIENVIDALSNIDLPDWLTPGSPTPFEVGLLGIADALGKVNVEAAQFGSMVNPGKLATQANTNITNYNSYNLTVQTNAGALDVVSDFNLLRTLTGA